MYCVYVEIVIDNKLREREKKAVLVKVGQIKSIKSDKNQEQYSDKTQINDRTIRIAWKLYRIKVLKIYSSVENMERAVKISVCILLCGVFVSQTNGENDLILENVNEQMPDVLENRMPLVCQYNYTSGDHICDCNYRNTV